MNPRRFPVKRSRPLLILLFLTVVGARAVDEPPTEWIDPDTGHRVVRLSREPGTSSLYFHQNAYTAGGTKVLVTTRHGLATIDLNSGAIETVVDGRVGVIVTGRKTGAIYYQKDGWVCAIDPATKRVRQVVRVPEHGSIGTVNADETLLAGTIVQGGQQGPPPAEPPAGAASFDAPPPRAGRAVPGRDNYPGKGAMMERRWAAHAPMVLFTLSAQTGEYKEVLHSTDWLNHLQFSPTDPALLLFCHEGPWHKVDRIWTLRVDGAAQPTLIHKRTMKMEIAGHEFWSADGQWIYYDLQTPRSEDFWVGGYQLATGRRRWYHLQRDEWSVHYNLSRDGTLFAGDGGAPTNVARAKDGKWIYLFRPELVPDEQTPADQKDLVQIGIFRAERLVNLKDHDYSLEPNVTFTPDGRWLVFRSNIHGATQVYAVEVAKAPPKP